MEKSLTSKLSKMVSIRSERHLTIRDTRSWVFQSPRRTSTLWTGSKSTNTYRISMCLEIILPAWERSVRLSIWSNWMHQTTNWNLPLILPLLPILNGLIILEIRSWASKMHTLINTSNICTWITTTYQLSMASRPTKTWECFLLMAIKSRELKTFQICGLKKCLSVPTSWLKSKAWKPFQFWEPWISPKTRFRSFVVLKPLRASSS